MARGIGGDDGPSIFMFGACVLGFIWVRDNLKSAGDSVSKKLELGQNSGGILQDETTRDIARMEKSAATIPVRWTNCKRPRAFYQSVADDIWTECKANYYVDTDKMFELVEPLNADELKAVAKYFGVRETTFLGVLTLGSYDIVKAMKAALSDGFLAQNETRMRQIWSKTGLW